MIIQFYNNQDLKIPSEQRILDICVTALQIAGRDIAVMLYISHVDKDTISRLNTDFRDKPSPTDVLSFTYNLDVIAERNPANFIGEVIICPQFLNLSYEQTLIHGILHLLGYDHIDDHDHQKMLLKESEILNNTRNY